MIYLVIGYFTLGILLALLQIHDEWDYFKNNKLTTKEKLWVSFVLAVTILLPTHVMAFRKGQE